jgi:hypothetical protein
MDYVRLESAEEPGRKGRGRGCESSRGVGAVTLKTRKQVCIAGLDLHQSRAAARGHQESHRRQRDVDLMS